ncbi:hypothetical protein [Adhaeribacter aquaticus]|uniref:hypothetical protein n=1 Tax=Adhaeribacter aquaticus TaxID=299567 RepID=UPI0012F8D824|nr:hypothetical protein [Adhaeribacter aquaticus]
MPITDHQFLDLYPVKTTDTKMIVGTIHPHLIENFRIPFFYGNVGSFWNILHHAFPHYSILQHDDLVLGNILAMLELNNIWITDIIRQCERENETITKDALLYNIVLNIEQIELALENTEINTIYFTSGFGINNAAQLFTQAFGINYLENYNAAINEFTIPENQFGREIRCIVLYSPSNAANIGISRSIPYLNNIEYYQQFQTPVKQFKIDYYQSKFQLLN